MERCRRPNRSDVHLSAEEEAQMADKTREYFHEKEPKRHTKPQQSEYSTNYVDGGDNGNEIPEYVEFQRLETDPQHLQPTYNGGKVGEEFVETEYYKDLNRVDKKHHTTGTGFIKVEQENSPNKFSLEPDLDPSCHASCKGNPATNDWIPAATDMLCQ